MTLQPKNNLKDAGTEKALLAAIIKGGKDAFIDADGILSPNDLAFPLNRSIYACLSQLSQNDTCVSFDVESIKMKGKTTELVDFSDKRNSEYLDILFATHAEKENIQMFAMQVRKLSIMRQLYSQYESGIEMLSKCTGVESLSDIIAKTESDILSFLSNGADEDDLIRVGDKIVEVVTEHINSVPVDQIGIPTGFPIWDDAIGGGLRGGSVMIIGARSKVGKSWDALNKARNIAKRNIPVLYLDTELNKEIQMSRLVSIDSKCPIYLYETSKFKDNAELLKTVSESAKQIQKLPLYYQSISGKSPHEAMSIIRRWIIKCVGVKPNGHAKDCVVIYDYFKLTTDKELSSYNPEHIALGFLLTQMHNFAHKYNIPMLGYVQLNRDGIDSEDTSVVAASDRILWLCSSLSLLKNKDETDVGLGCGFDHGNKKMIVLETRFGSGLDAKDYINLHASLKPNVSKSIACGFMREGYQFSMINSGKQGK